MISNIVKDEGLMKNIMQSLGYFAFISLFVRHGAPAVKGNLFEVTAFVSIYIGLLIAVMAFTIAHVVRPMVQKKYPRYRLKKIDPCYVKTPTFTRANMYAAFLIIVFSYIGFTIVGFGVV